MTHALISQVAIALLSGATLSTPRCTVGKLDDCEEGLRFVCRTGDGEPIEAVEAWEQTISRFPGDRTGFAADRVIQRALDFSAFGAAKSFVERELRYSRTSVEKALKEAGR